MIGLWEILLTSEFFDFYMILVEIHLFDARSIDTCSGSSDTLFAHHWTVVPIGLQQLAGVVLHKLGRQSRKEGARHV